MLGSSVALPVSSVFLRLRSFPALLLVVSASFGAFRGNVVSSSCCCAVFVSASDFCAFHRFAAPANPALAPCGGACARVPDMTPDMGCLTSFDMLNSSGEEEVATVEDFLWCSGVIGGNSEAVGDGESRTIGLRAAIDRSAYLCRKSRWKSGRASAMCGVFGDVEMVDAPKREAGGLLVSMETSAGILPRTLVRSECQDAHAHRRSREI